MMFGKEESLLSSPGHRKLAAPFYRAARSTGQTGINLALSFLFQLLWTGIPTWGNSFKFVSISFIPMSLCHSHDQSVSHEAGLFFVLGEGEGT